MMEINDGKDLNKLLAGCKKAVVLFFAGWCPYSRSFRPIFESECTKLKECSVAIAIVDEDDNPLWDRCGVERVPTVVYFKNGKIAKQLVETSGEGLSKSELVSFLKSLELV